VQTRDCPCTRLSNGSGAQREHRAPEPSDSRLGGLHAAVHPRERTSCAKPSSVFGFVPADQCCVVVAGGSPSKGKPDARYCAWRFAGLAVADVRTCLHLPAVLTTPANRASPPRCRGADSAARTYRATRQSHLPRQQSSVIALPAPAFFCASMGRSGSRSSARRGVACLPGAGSHRVPLRRARPPHGPAFGLVSRRCRACRSRLCLSELALGGIDDTGSVLV
jgi:hypothetical protein